MQSEYLFLTEKAPQFPLDESITVCLENDNQPYIVSNEKVENSQIYAPEINFYLRNTEDNVADTIRNIKILYEARAAVYDLAQDMDYSVDVGKKVLIVMEEASEELGNKLEKDGFTVLTLSPDEITDVNGHIGALKVSTNKLIRGDLETDQILWYGAPDFAMKQSGVYDPAEEGWKEAIEKLYTHVDSFAYKNYVQYDPTICQYQGRLLKETCGKCEEVCPSVAITKTDEEKQLHFSDVDCHGCGGCVSVCPSGALDFTQMPRDAFSEAASFYTGKQALIIPSQVSLSDIPLPPGVLPFAIEGRKYLHETHFLTLLQKSGHAVIFYTDFLSKGTGDAVRLINEIFERKYQKKAIYLCMNEAELVSALAEAESIEACSFDMADAGMKKREIFTYRLAHLVGEDDLGVVETGEHIHYGNLNINEANCTLCMACVGVCNVAALTAHPEDNTLKFNPSLCTNCGYCEVACPEEACLEVVYDRLSLRPDYFRKNTMAQDTLFACVECGKEFATTKSIEKIAAMMAPRFGGDEAKIRTLYCCADCKPKVMMQSQINQEMERKS